MRGRCPQIGDTKIKKRFLLFPKCIGDEWRWLEFAVWLKVFKQGKLYPYWVEKRWEN